MTLPSHPPIGGTRLQSHRSSHAASWWKVHAKRFAYYYLFLISFLFLWSASYLNQPLMQQEYQDQQPVVRVRSKDLFFKLPLWNPQQHTSANVPLTGSYRYLGDEHCQRNDPSCQGRMFFPTVDLKNALPFDEAVDLVKGIRRNYNESSSSVLPKNKNEPAISKSLAVLTRGGNKDFAAAGSVTANQDRILLLQLHPNDAVYEDKKDFIMALLDGHGTDGHVVSHHAALNLAPVLIKHLSLSKSSPSDALTQTFLELENSIPSTADAGSGSTGIVMLRKRNRLYIANTGDSFAFVGSYDATNKNVNIVYETKPHKPHLQEERARIEAAGGQVVQPQGPGDSSRVIIPMGEDDGGLAMALAMSRSIGDKQGTSLGVIANPTIDVLNLKTLEVGKELFAVVASDGLFDKVDAKQVAETIAGSLFDENNTKTPLEACHELIMKSSYGWIAQGSPYRDDISVATAILVRENDD